MSDAREWKASYAVPCFGCGRAIEHGQAIVPHDHLARGASGRWLNVRVRYHVECFRGQSTARAGRQTHRAELRERTVHGAAGQTVRQSCLPRPAHEWRVSRTGVLRPRKGGRNA